MKIQHLTLLFLLLLLACRPDGQPIPVTRLPGATAVPPNAATLLPTPSRTNTPAVSPTALPSATPEPITSDAAFTYTSDTGNFAIDLPARTLVYENYFPSVDGVFVEIPNSVSFIRSEPNFALTVVWTAVARNVTLNDFIAEQSQCISITPDEGESMMFSGQETRLYDEVNCGPFYTSFLYLLSENQGYILTIRANTPIRFLQGFIEPMLDSFTLLNAAE